MGQEKNGHYQFGKPFRQSRISKTTKYAADICKGGRSLLQHSNV